MKKLFFFSILATLCLSFVPNLTQASVAVPSWETTIAEKQQDAVKSSEKKLSFKEKLAFHQIKKMVKKGHQRLEDLAVAGRGIKPLAFIMGFLFSLIGILIVLIVGGDVRSAAIGALVSLLIWLLIVAL